MFKQPCLLFLCLVVMIIPRALSGQTIVSTSQTNKNAVLEEFGGMYCIYCPSGHEILTALETALDDRLVTINYHSGPYASPIGDDPDLGNDYSYFLEQRAYITGYPAATINRHNFSGLEQSGIPGITAIGRADWAEAVTEIIQEPALVNIAAEATLNITTRELELYIEYYYTGNAANNANRLHIGILQNNVFAPQHGGDAGDYYLHQHLFRDYITGYDGHIINNTQAGAFGSLTYNIILPEYYRDVWMDVVNLELAMFISEGEENILQGIKLVPTLLASAPVDVNLIAIVADNDICDDEFSAQLSIRNDGFHNLANCIIRYGIEGGASNEISWSGSLVSLASTTIDLPSLPVYPGNYHNTFFVEIISPNDEDDPTAYNNYRTHNFTQAPVIESELIELAIRTDEYGYELYWEIVDDYGVVYGSGGNLVVAETNGGAQIATDNDPGAYADEIFIIEEIYLPAEGCYQLRVLDDFADGICCNYGNGFYRLRIPGQTPFIEGGAFGALEEKFFTLGFGATTASQNSMEVNQEPTLFPNPLGSQQSLGIRWTGEPPSAYDWQIANGSGQLLLAGSQDDQPDISKLSAGYYLFQLRYAEKQRVLPLVVHR